MIDALLNTVGAHPYAAVFFVVLILGIGVVMTALGRLSDPDPADDRD